MEKIELKADFDENEIPRELLFEIIADIPKYPEFVPGYKRVEVLEKRENYIKVKIFPTIPISPMIMEADLIKPDTVKFRLIEGPLDVFEGEWKIEKEKIYFNVIYYVKSWLKRKLVYKFVKMSCDDILYSFKLRAKKLLKKN